MYEDEMQVLRKALERCELLLQDSPDFQPLRSCKAQLEYLLGLLDGSSADRSRLKEIILGVYAAREFEMRDSEFAQLLHEAEEIVEGMKRRAR